MDQLLRDLQYAARTARRRPGFAVVVIATLAIGLGANGSIFSVVNSVLLRPLPYAAPERLFAIDGMSYSGEFVELQRRAQTFDVAAFAVRQATVTGDAEPLRAPAAGVSPNFVTLLGARPQLGRGLLEGDELARDGAVVLIAHQLWRSRFGGDPAILGRRVVVDGVARAVVGVMPADFAFPAVETQLWIPIASPTDRIAMWATSRRLIGRLRPHASMADAHAEVRTLAPSMRALFPWNMPADYGQTAAAIPLQESLVQHVRTTLMLLLGAVGVVLLIACVNVSHLLVARALARRRELAIRASLGAARGRILRHVLAEGILFVAAGVAAAVPIGYAGVRVLAASLPAEMPRPVGINADARMILFATVAVAAAALLVGLVPALRASRIDLASQLADTQRTGAGRGTRWTSNVLVAAQMALAVVLVVTASLLVRSLANLSAISPGFAADHVLSVRISPPQYRFKDVAARNDLYATILERTAAGPGVTAVAVTDRLPFSGEVFGSVFVIEGRPNPATTGEWPMADVSATVSPGYFGALGVAVTAGRPFNAEDTSTSQRVAIVSETLARRYWPGEQVVGRRFTFPGDVAGMRTIVGVVADVKWERVTDDAKGSLFVPLAQGSPASMRLVVRAGADANATFEHLRSVVRSVDRDTPVDQMRTLDALVAASVEQPRFAATLLSGFAIAGLLLGAIGIFGTISDHVTQRRREIGVRMALGARRPDVVRTVLGGTFLVVSAGAAVGIALAAGVTHLFGALLFGVEPTDAVTFVTSLAVLMLTAIAAAYAPARRAASIDPISALRE